MSVAEKTNDDVDLDAIVHEHMDVLGISGPRPDVRVRDNLGSKWLGRTTWSPKDGEIWIEVQASVLGHRETLERVIAHEVVHVVEFMTMSEADVELAKLGRGTWEPSHGSKFRELAAVINEAKGADFVTEKSDEDYELAENARDFIIVVEEVNPGSGRLGWSWTARPSKATQEKIARKLAAGAVVARTTDARFCKGVKMGKGKIGMAIPKKGSEVEAELQRIWDEGKQA